MDSDKSKTLDISAIQSKWITTMNTVLQTLNMAECDIENNDNNEVSHDIITSQLNILSHIQHDHNHDHDHDEDHVHDAFDSSTMKTALLKDAHDILKLKKLEQAHLRNLIEAIEPLDFEKLTIVAHELVNDSTNQMDNDNNESNLHCENNVKGIELISYKSQLMTEIMNTLDVETLELDKLVDDSVSYDFDCDNSMEVLSKIIAVKDFDPLAKQQQLVQKCIIKHTISLMELIHQKDRINMQTNKANISEFQKSIRDGKQISYLNPLLDNVILTHSPKEFLTFCLCKSCKEYNELFFRIMADHFRASHMLVMLLDGLVKAYGSMLKNVKASNKFKQLIGANKKICWITTGFYYQQLSEHLNFVDHLSYSDQIISLLFSSVLMLNNPMLLLQILAFHVECVVKAFVEGFLEIVAPTQVTIAVKMLNYLLNGYDELMRIADQVASTIFAFENAFLRKFHLTWKLLCQRLYRQHVYLRLTDTMLACVITLKDLELTPNNAALIKRYVHFDDIMTNVERLWSLVWWELNKYNLSDVECKRRKNSMEIFQIFNTVKDDAKAFESPDDDADMTENCSYSFTKLKDCRLIWYRIMTCAKTKWSKEFFEPPNTLIVDSKCIKCGALLSYHSEDCTCITCSIAGSPLPPKTKELIGFCNKCSTLALREKELLDICESEILNACAKDDFLNAVKNRNSKCSNNVVKSNKDCTIQTIGNDGSRKQKVEEIDEPSPSKSVKTNKTCGFYKISDLIQTKHFPISLTTATDAALRHNYHISWAVFTHLNNRIRYPHKHIEQTYLCYNCPQPACQLAIKILNDEISLDLTMELLKYYQPIIMTRNELQALLPKIMFYHHKLIDVSLNIRCQYSKMDANSYGDDDVMSAHDYLVKIYWIFVISIYATYFIKVDADYSKSPNLQYLELHNDDVRVKVGKIRGNKKDKKLHEFLNKIKSLPTQHIKETDEVNAANLESKLNELINMAHVTEYFPNDLENHIPTAYEMIVSNVSNANRKGIELSEVHDCTNPKLYHKKLCKELSRKCCFEHKDINECFKEGHANKKRLKKDCNHGRVSETRERLRKKLSQIVRENVHVEKSAVTIGMAGSGTSANASTEATSDSASNSLPLTSRSTSLSKEKQCLVSESDEFTVTEKLKKSISLDESVVSTNAVDGTSNSNFKKSTMKTSVAYHCNKNRNNNVDCLNNLCNHVTHLHTSSDAPSTKSSDEISSKKKKQEPQQNENEKCEQGKMEKEKQNGKENENRSKCVQAAKNIKSPMKQKETNAPTNKCKEITNAPYDSNAISLKSINIANCNNRKGLNVANEISNELINEQEWIKETLNYIEGSKKHQQNLGNNWHNNVDGKNRKMQPQTINPKKAAKKAKQKQRKEEQKRVLELHELRSQFENIYFKEFTEKHLLKILKTNKKLQQRDKKRIALMEANIKNLQRAKAKVEVNILELIAIVKQTNPEFKFPYLPTKEQQLEKLKQLEEIHDKPKSLDKSNMLNSGNSNVNNNTCEKGENQNAKIAERSSDRRGRHDICGDACDSVQSDLNIRHESYAIPYAQANHFPIQLNVLASSTSASVPGLAPMPVLAPSVTSSAVPILPDHHSFDAAPFNLVRSTSVCYAPPLSQNQQLSSHVMSAMAANVLGNSSTMSSTSPFNNNISNNSVTSNNIDPSKRIVTIRRVNLPNVSEPQVTVTARGSSPDKDKLLYTFINGQLIPTENLEDADLLPISLQQEPNNNQTTTTTILAPLKSTIQQTIAKLPSKRSQQSIQQQQSVEQNLSKSQVKKERRRLAKLYNNDNQPISSLHYTNPQQICTNNNDVQGNPLKKKTKEEHLRKMEEKPIKKALLKIRTAISEAMSDVAIKDYYIHTNHHDYCKSTPKTKILNKSPSNSSLSTIESSAHYEKSKITKNSDNKNNQQLQQKQQQHNNNNSNNNNNNNNKKSLKKKNKGTTAITTSVIMNNNSDDSESTIEYPFQKGTYKSSQQHEQQKKQQKQKQHKQQKHISINEGSTSKTVTAVSASKQHSTLSLSATSFSAATMSSLTLSGNSVSSQINTRENSASSIKLLKLNQKHCTEATTSDHNKKHQMKNSKTVLKNEQNQTKIQKSNKNKKQQTQQQKESQYFHESKVLEEKNNNKKKLLASPSVCPETSNTNKSSKQTSSTPIVDNGQFDNNPFKSLHMQETDSDDITEPLQSENENKHEYEKVQMHEQQQQQQKQKCSDTLRNNKMTLQKKHLDAIRKLSNDNNHISNEECAISKSQQEQYKTIMIKSKSLESKEKPKKVQQQEQLQHNKNEQTTMIGKYKKRKNKIENGKVLKEDNSDNNHKCGKHKCQLLENTIKRGNALEFHKKQHRYNANHDNDISINIDDGGVKQCATYKLIEAEKTERNKKAKQKQPKCNQSNYSINDISQSISSLKLNNATPTTLPSQAASLASTSKIRTSGTPNHHQFTNVLNAEPCGITKYNTLEGGDCYTEQTVPSNISIMDQLNRGVEVENLSLPPGITLTRVDPIKSEQLRQKSESIKKLAMPLQQQQLQHPLQAYQHHHHTSTTIIAPPVAPVTSYFGLPYGGSIGGGVASTIDPQSGIIMVEANRPSSSTSSLSLSCNASNANTSCNANKQSKNKKRRNKSRHSTNVTTNSAPIVTSNESTNTSETKMITLRNPMFHKTVSNVDGITKSPTGVATPILSQPFVPSTGRPYENYTSPLDQPAAIIKNDNGMYTIRNPALHQAVTNGLTLGGYCQFGNINYYTPHEVTSAGLTTTVSVASTTTATITKAAQHVPKVGVQIKQQRQQQQQERSVENDNYLYNSKINSLENVSETFSYFSHDTKLPANIGKSVDTVTAAATNIDINFNSNCGIYDNNIGISSTNFIEKRTNTNKDNNGFDEHEGESCQVGATQQHKFLSAIGSEMKNAQQQKQKKSNTKTQIWSLSNIDQTKNVNSVAANSTLHIINDQSVDDTLNSEDMTLQQKYRHSKYFNGFDECMPHNSASLYNHSCGDDSPPPSIDNYTSTYLDGIPNTGIIRYDNVSFLKNLMPRQTLNNEVSIHTVNNSHYVNGTNNSGTASHHPEMRPIYGLQDKSLPSHNTQSHTLINTPSSGPTTAVYIDAGPLNYYHTTDTANLNTVTPKFSQADDQTKMINNKSPVSTKYMEYQLSNQPTMYRHSLESSDNQCSILDFNDMLNNKEERGHGSSLFLNETFIKNMNNLQISITTSSNEQTSQIIADKIISSSSTIANNTPPHGDESASGNNNSWW